MHEIQSAPSGGAPDVIEQSTDQHLNDLISLYRQSMTAAGHSDETIRSRILGVRQLAYYAGVDPVTATIHDVELWLSRDLRPWSRRTYFTHARAWFAWLVERGERDDNPLEKVHPPRVPRAVPRPLDDDAVQYLLETSTGYLRSFALLALFAGLRIHEIAKIRGADVSVTSLRVVGKGGVIASLPTHPLIWQDAQNYPRDLQYWFPSYLSASGHIAPGSVTQAVRRALDEIGVHGTPHQLRHRYGTDVYKASGGDLLRTQRLLRHANVSTTQGYALVEDESLRPLVHALGERWLPAQRQAPENEAV